jgi:hypothetical protein
MAFIVTRMIANINGGTHRLIQVIGLSKNDRRRVGETIILDTNIYTFYIDAEANSDRFYMYHAQNCARSVGIDAGGAKQSGTRAFSP